MDGRRRTGLTFMVDSSGRCTHCSRICGPFRSLPAVQGAPLRLPCGVVRDRSGGEYASGHRLLSLGQPFRAYSASPAALMVLIDHHIFSIIFSVNFTPKPRRLQYVHVVDGTAAKQAAAATFTMAPSIEPPKRYQYWWLAAPWCKPSTPTNPEFHGIADDAALFQEEEADKLELEVHDGRRRKHRTSHL